MKFTEPFIYVIFTFMGPDCIKFTFYKQVSPFRQMCLWTCKWIWYCDSATTPVKADRPTAVQRLHQVYVAAYNEDSV